jgi:hypothetical protein
MTHAVVPRTRTGCISAVPRADTAPVDLRAMLWTIRDSLVDSPYRDVTGCCMGASIVIARNLRAAGWAAYVWHGSYGGGPHAICRAGPWAMDPTVEQFGEDEPAIFRWSERPRRYARRGRPIPSTAEELVAELATWRIEGDPGSPWPKRGRGLAVSELLEAASLQRLAPLVTAT